MSILTGGSLARSLWAAPSLKPGRRRIYTVLTAGFDLLVAAALFQDLQLLTSGADLSTVSVDAVVPHLAIGLILRVLLYVLLSAGRRSSFRIERERMQVETGAITIDEAVNRFCQWPKRRLIDASGRPLKVNATGSPVFGAAFAVGPVLRLRPLGARSWQWVDPTASMRSDGQMRTVLNPRSRSEWVLPFPSLSDHAIPEGYIGRSVQMLEAAEEMRRFREERKLNAPRNAVSSGATSFRNRPAPDYTYTPYTGKIPEQVLDVLSDLVAVRSEVSAMHILWSSRPGTAPQLTALVEAHHDRTSVAGDVSKALGSVPGGSRLEVRLMDPREASIIRDLGTVAVA